MQFHVKNKSNIVVLIWLFVSHKNTENFNDEWYNKQWRGKRMLVNQCVFSSLPKYVSTIFVTFRKKGPRPKWTIYKRDSDKNEKCLSVCNFEILSVTHPKAYYSLSWGLKYLLKIPYSILNFPNVARLLIFKTVCLSRLETLAYVCTCVW